MRFNEKNETITTVEYRAILVGLQLHEDISYSMEELAGLAEAAEIQVVGEMIQNRDRPDKTTLIGKGKVEELAEACRNMEADTVVFNDELSGMQLRNLEDKLQVRVLDRTILILDIFATRAVSKEGKLQVELAQLQYRLPRLTGFGKSLSQQGAGIGTRGPGEKKLETDRRHITKRMDEIKKELENVKNTRATQRSRREKSEIPVVALVGYTNSGKSAIMNKLLQLAEKEDKSVFEDNMLFATLDTSQRSIRLETNQEFVLIDTVGFVSKLPHSLIQAFKSTLEEVTYADLLLHVVDASFPGHDFHIQVTNKVLEELGVSNTEKIMIYNKMDIAGDTLSLPVNGEETIYISAKMGDNMDKVLESIKERLFSGRTKVSMLVPYERGDITSYIQEKYEIQHIEYREEGTYLEIEITPMDRGRLESFILSEEVFSG